MEASGTAFDMTLDVYMISIDPESIQSYPYTKLFARYSSLIHMDRIQQIILYKYDNRIQDNRLITAASSHSCTWVECLAPPIKDTNSTELNKL